MGTRAPIQNRHEAASSGDLGGCKIYWKMFEGEGQRAEEGKGNRLEDVPLNRNFYCADLLKGVLQL